MLVRKLDDVGDLLRVLRKDDRFRTVFEQGKSIAFVDEEFGFVGNDAVLAHDLLKFSNDFGAHYLVPASSSTCLICRLMTSSSGRSG